MPNERNFPEVNDPNARLEINTDENGVPFEQVVTYVDENSDQPEKQEIYHYGENGNLIMDVLHLVNGYGEPVDISQVERHYDEAGNLEVTTWDPREFDENGNLLEYDDNFSIETEKFTYEYDENNREIMSEYVDINGDIKTVERTYNEDGQEINTKSYFNGDLQYDTDRIYDDKGQEVEVRIHNGELSQYSEEKVLQNLIIKEYDENNQLRKETNEQKLAFQFGVPFHVNIKEWDERGDFLSEMVIAKDPEGRVNNVSFYDEDGRLIKKDYYDKTIVIDEQIRNGTAHAPDTTRREIYDEIGDFEGYEITNYEYDGNGELKSRSEYDDREGMEMTYDSNNVLRKVIDYNHPNELSVTEYYPEDNKRITTDCFELNDQEPSSRVESYLRKVVTVTSTPNPYYLQNDEQEISCIAYRRNQDKEYIPEDDITKELKEIDDKIHNMRSSMEPSEFRDYELSMRTQQKELMDKYYIYYDHTGRYDPLCPKDFRTFIDNIYKELKDIEDSIGGIRSCLEPSESKELESTLRSQQKEILENGKSLELDSRLFPEGLNEFMENEKLDISIEEKENDRADQYVEEEMYH